MTYPELANLRITRDGPIAIVTINRPDIMNSVPPEVHSDLEKVWLPLSEDASVRAIVLTGEGKYFSAGGNIRSQVERWGTSAQRAYIATVPERAKRIVHGMLNCPKPIIAAVNGDAMGLGATLVVMSDISVMAADARIGDTHVRVGLVAGDGGPVIWPLLVGANQAKNFLMRGLVVNGTDAAQRGIVSEAVAREEVLAHALRIAHEVSSLPPLAVQWTKVSANLIVRQQFDAVMDAAIAYECLSLHSEDHLEAAKAFLEKRPGVYRGQ